MWYVPSTISKVDIRLKGHIIPGLNLTVYLFGTKPILSGDQPLEEILNQDFQFTTIIPEFSYGQTVLCLFKTPFLDLTGKGLLGYYNIGIP